MKLTNRFIYHILENVYPALLQEEVDGKVRARRLRVKLNFALDRNRDEFRKVIKSCEESKRKLIAEYVKHDDDGNPMSEEVKDEETGQVTRPYIYESEDDRFEHNREFAELMTTRVDVPVHRVSMEYLPDPIEPALQEALAFMLSEYEINDEEEANEGDANDES